ncbi:MAG: hypothetical protein DMG19_15690 [Acidobacteria bacterium]|nr:MAG: hypothetical protein DMG19_15690 [Acidobacteriota bacterium]
MEFIMTPDKILQVFQWEHRIRYLWTDGRELPSGENLENLGPAWYGHSVAKWEGNTLVVNTVGLDERAWLDNTGLPKSFHARIEERYTRTVYNTVELQMTLYDPEYYTIQSGIQGSQWEGVAFERELLAQAFASADAAEGLNAYREKRVAKFQGK